MTADGRLIAGRYRILRPLATGGMSRVWLAVDELLDRRVAVKKCVVPDGLSPVERELVRTWTVQGARAVSRVVHPNVVGILDVLMDGDEPWIVMEHIPSRSLLQVIEQSGPMPPERVAAIGLALLAGLDAAGRVGLLHLDVKPGNVLIAPDGRVVLTDFGPAVTNEAVGALTGAGIILGSPRYVAPERLFDGTSSARADLWSLGATLYHAVEGRPPFVRDTIEDTLRALADSSPDRPRRAGPLTAVLNGLLRRDPQERLSPAAAERLLRLVATSGAPYRPTGTAPAVPPLPAASRSAVPKPAVAPISPAASRPAPSRPAPSRPAASRPAAPDLPAPPAADADPVPPPVPPLSPPEATGPVTPVPLGRRFAGQARRFAAAAAVLVVLTGLAALAGTDHRPRPAASPTVGPVTAPPGYTWWRDPSGFRVAVPAGWRGGPDGPGAVRFTAPGGRPGVRVDVWSPAPTNLVAALTAEERAVGLDAYRRIRIVSAPPGAVWEYTYADPAGGPTRVEWDVIVAGGRAYRLQWWAPRYSWAADLPVLDAIRTTFTPAPGP
jgi:serine/threonine protein kinase